MKEAKQNERIFRKSTPEESKNAKIKLAIYLLKSNGYKIYKVTEV